MKNTTVKSQYYTSSGEPHDFERYFIAIVAFISAIILIYLSFMGPMAKGEIIYKTHPIIINQVIAQDAVNAFVMAPLLLIAALGLILKWKQSKYFLSLAPLYMIYFAISYGLGWEWMAPTYWGNSEAWFFHYLFILISSLLILLYCFRVFPSKARFQFKKSHLMVYSTLCTLFLILFGMMWTKEVFEVIQTGTSRSYDLSPTAFWLVRLFDLGFSIPLGLVSVYLLWISPAKAFAIQMLFFGFFVTMSIVVNAMSLVMYINEDPTFEPISSLIFLCLFLIVMAGYIFVLKAYNPKK